MKQYRLCFLGFGNVGRALARLLVAKSTELRSAYGIEWSISGVLRDGWAGVTTGMVATFQVCSQEQRQTTKQKAAWLNG